MNAALLVTVALLMMACSQSAPPRKPCTTPQGTTCPSGAPCPSNDVCNHYHCYDGQLTISLVGCHTEQAPTSCVRNEDCNVHRQERCWFEQGCDGAPRGRCMEGEGEGPLPWCGCNGRTFVAGYPQHRYSDLGHCPL